MAQRCAAQRSSVCGGLEKEDKNKKDGSSLKRFLRLKLHNGICVCRCICINSCVTSVYTYLTNVQREGVKEKHDQKSTRCLYFMAFVNTLLFFLKSEQGLLSVGGEIARNVFHAQMHLFFPINNFPLYLSWHHSLHNFPHHQLILLPETYSQVLGYVINTLYGCCSTLSSVQNC